MMAQTSRHVDHTLWTGERVLGEPAALDRKHGPTQDVNCRPNVSHRRAAAEARAQKGPSCPCTYAPTRPHICESAPPRRAAPLPRLSVLLAHFEKTKNPSSSAMCHDPSPLQGRCREQARPAEQVRNHRHGFGLHARAKQVSTALVSFFFFPCLLSQLLHRVPSFPVHALSMPVPCPSSRPSPIANLLAPWLCQALQTIACSPGG